MLKGSTNDNYKISPIKKEIKEFYIGLYKLGINTYLKLQDDTKKYTELLQLFNRLNEERQKRGQKPKTLNKKQFASQYRQYIHMSGLYIKKEDKRNQQKFKSYIRMVKNEEIKEETKQLEAKRDIAKEELKESKEVKKRIDDKIQEYEQITKENLSYISTMQQAEEFTKQNFYQEQTKTILAMYKSAKNVLDVINNYLSKLSQLTPDNQSVSLIEKLTSNYDKITQSIISSAKVSSEITKLPVQAINFLMQNNIQQVKQSQDDIEVNYDNIDDLLKSGNYILNS